MNELPYKEIDNLCDYALTNIYTLSKKNMAILLNEVDINKDDHLFVINICLIAHDVFGWPIYYVGKFWDWIKLKRKIRKQRKGRIRYLTFWRRRKIIDFTQVIFPEALINFMKPLITSLVNDKLTFGDIYRIYYSNERDINI